MTQSVSAPQAASSPAAKLGHVLLIAFVCALELGGVVMAIFFAIRIGAFVLALLGLLLSR